MAAGRSNGAIGSRLFLSKKTVEVQVRNDIPQAGGLSNELLGCTIHPPLGRG